MTLDCYNSTNNELILLHQTGLDFYRSDGVPNNVKGLIFLVGQYESHQACKKSSGLKKLPQQSSRLIMAAWSQLAVSKPGT